MYLCCHPTLCLCAPTSHSLFVCAHISLSVCVRSPPQCSPPSSFSSVWLRIRRSSHLWMPPQFPYDGPGAAAVSHERGTPTALGPDFALYRCIISSPMRKRLLLEQENACATHTHRQGPTAVGMSLLFSPGEGVFGGPSKSQCFRRTRTCAVLLGYLAQKETPIPPGPPQDPRHRPAAGS